MLMYIELLLISLTIKPGFVKLQGIIYYCSSCTIITLNLFATYSLSVRHLDIKMYLSWMVVFLSG